MVAIVLSLGMTKIDITSTIVEKSFDTAKGFLGKLLSPAIEEVGGILKDQVSSFRFNNQVRMLVNAKAKCEKNGISPKAISFKLLVPLIEYSGLEEDDELLDKWANLLSNMADSEQNIQNHVFPYILSQLSTNEFSVINAVYDTKIKQDIAIREDIKVYNSEMVSKIIEHQTRINGVDNELSELTSKGKNGSQEFWATKEKKDIYESELKAYIDKKDVYVQLLATLQEIPRGFLRDFEMSNLVRLGLAQLNQEFYSKPQRLAIPRQSGLSGVSFLGQTVVDFDIEAGLESQHVLTELGFLFVKACKEKNS